MQVVKSERMQALKVKVVKEYRMLFIIIRIVKKIFITFSHTGKTVLQKNRFQYMIIISPVRDIITQKKA